MERFGLSQRRACRILSITRQTLRYDGKKKDEEQIRKRMREIAERRRRFGSPRIHVMLQREGLVVNHKCTERIYKEEGLSLKMRKRKKRAAVARIELPKPDRPNQRWSMDFMLDQLSSGRRIRILTIVDEIHTPSLIGSVWLRPQLS